MTDKEKQIDEMAKTAIYRAVNGRRCLRSGHCKHCGAHKAVSNPQYEKCDCYRIAEIIFDAGYRKHVEGEWLLHKDGRGTCKVCRRTQKAVWDDDRYQNYCGCCGAKMKGGEYHD